MLRLPTTALALLIAVALLAVVGLLVGEGMLAEVELLGGGALPAGLTLLAGAGLAGAGVAVTVTVIAEAVTVVVIGVQTDVVPLSGTAFVREMMLSKRKDALRTLRMVGLMENIVDGVPLLVVEYGIVRGNACTG